ncbi:Fic family protein [Microbulbifer sp. TRSA001]|uniref:Fic family protein n=1 Tax=Microbulbifer sp. TRSA001 TaxID=3243381 RepID=UPI004039C43B
MFNKYGATDADGNYLHWDKFKWRVNKGDSEELAWLTTKLARKGISKVLPNLEAVNGKNFSYCIPDSLFAKLHHIDMETGAGRSLEDDVFFKGLERDKYLVKSLMMEEAITSSQLEGASTTRKVAKEMLKSNRKPADKSEQMIFNNYLLMKRAVEKKDEELSVDLILELHEIATFNAIENQAVPGEIRKDNDIEIKNLYGEVAFRPPCYKTIRDRMDALCAFANLDTESGNSDKFIHPVVKAAILHFMIGFIHPFGDGNGRTARALFYWYMLRAGYWLFEYVSISKLIQEKRSQYDTAFIYAETDDFDLTYFIYNQVDVIDNAVIALRNHIESKKQDFYHFMEWIDRSELAKGLKRGELEIVKDALQNPGKRFTAQKVAIDIGVNENTARSYLNTLVEKNLLESTKKKNIKTIFYIAPDDVREVLHL